MWSIKSILAALILCLGIFTLYTQTELPPIQGRPILYQPDLLPWPQDIHPGNPDLTEPTSNRIYDLHMQIKDCEAMDLILSTSGNYHMALTDFWFDFIIPKYGLQNWYFSTSPPISPEQTNNSILTYTNISLQCQPHIAVGPKGVINALKKDSIIFGEPIPLFTNRGNVLLVKKGNPKNIKRLWDLERSDVVLATSNPYSEPGSFGNYAKSIYHMALHDGNETKALDLFESLFGKNTKKWIVGKRIHHREVPHLIYSDHADVGILFYHLARYMMKTFPHEFEIIPLGGTIENPIPLPGNQIGKLFLARINTKLTKKQSTAREQFISEIRDGAFDPYLEKHHINPIRDRK
ncbi:molybdate ABC transporter substrate-binding protein [Gangjinia marincola]